MTPVNYGLCTSVEMLERFVDRLLESGTAVSIDLETGADGPPRPDVPLHPEDPDAKIVGFSFTNSQQWARYVPLSHDGAGTRNLDGYLTARQLWRLCRSGLCIAHNARFELRFLKRFFARQLAGWDPDTDPLRERPMGPVDPDYGQEVIDAGGYFPVLSDTMIEAYVDAEAQRFGLKYLSGAMFGHDQTEFMDLFKVQNRKGEMVRPKGKAAAVVRFNHLPLSPEVVSYACDDVTWCLAIHEKLHPRVRDSSIYRVEMAIVPILCRMEDHGIRYEWEGFREAREKARAFNEAQQREIIEELRTRTGDPDLQVNLGSPPQLVEVLFGRLGLKSTKLTDSGKPSTDAVAMETLSKRDRTVKRILEWRETKKLLSSYLETYEDDYSYAPDGRVHPSHLQTAVGSGRFAVSSPNYQQTPRKVSYTLECSDGTVEKFDLNFRSLIRAPADHYILGFDYSQIELRVLAGLASEPALIAAFDNDEDVHSATAALMLGMALEDVEKEHRDKGKTLNFGIVYGLGIKGLADRLGIEKQAAEVLYEQYHRTFSGVSRWTRQVVTETLARGGFSISRFGRRTRIWELDSSDAWIVSKGERLCVNVPCQGAAADYMKFSMVRADRALEKAGMLGQPGEPGKVHMVMNVHDALEFYVHNSLTPQEVIAVLAPAVQWPVPGLPKMVAEWHMGPSWGELTELDATGLEVPEKAPVERTVPGMRESEQVEVKPEEGMPGTWSHCHSSADHAPHRHRVVLNEGPYENVQCLGTPGVPGAVTPPAQVAYEPAELLVVEPAPAPPATPGWARTSGEVLGWGADGEVAASASVAEVRGARLVITLSAMPDKDDYARFNELRRSRVLPDGPELVLRTPQGDLTYDEPTGFTPADGSTIGVLLGGAEVRWDAESLDEDALAAMTVGIEF